MQSAARRRNRVKEQHRQKRREEGEGGASVLLLSCCVCPTHAKHTSTQHTTRKPHPRSRCRRTYVQLASNVRTRSVSNYAPFPPSQHTVFFFFSSLIFFAKNYTLYKSFHFDMPIFGIMRSFFFLCSTSALFCSIYVVGCTDARARASAVGTCSVDFVTLGSRDTTTCRSSATRWSRKRDITRSSGPLMPTAGPTCQCQAERMPHQNYTVWKEGR